MKIFISWSGELGKLLGEVLHTWLPSTLQYVKPYFAPADIEKGAKWNAEISKNLEASRICIIVLTRESLNSRWILFEAGAISRGQSRICPILFGLEPTDVQGPLEQFQVTMFSKTDIYQLLVTINSRAEEDALEQTVLNHVFDMWWPDLERRINGIMSSAQSERPENLRNERSLLEEAVALMRAVHGEQTEILRFSKFTASHPKRKPNLRRPLHSSKSWPLPWSSSLPLLNSSPA
jgi:TIR domain